MVASLFRQRADFWLIVVLALRAWRTADHPDRRRRHAGRDLDANSYSGWAAAGIGFTLGNSALIITGALVGSSGAILSYIMCKGMNRSFISVILGGFGGESRPPAPVPAAKASGQARLCGRCRLYPEERAEGHHRAWLRHGGRAGAARAARNGRPLKKEGVEVKYAIHPVAGRMPGHMNVLLAEANVLYDEVFELEDINSEFAQADVAFVIGANDVTNPAAEETRNRRSTACRCSKSGRPGP